MFAITAITGRVGGALAETLLQANHKVRAIVRDKAKGAAWAKRGCEVAIADVSDADRLAAALTGVDGAFILLPPMFDPTPGFPEARAAIAVIREAIERAAPPKLVVLSTIGAEAAEPNLLNALGMLEAALSSLSVPITFLRAAWFMENAEWDVPGARNGVIESYLQPLDRPIPMIATGDVGRTAAELLLEDWVGHRVIELESAQRVSPNQIAAAFGKALDRPVVAKIVDRKDWETIFREQGMKNPTPRIQMLDGFNEGWIDFPGRGVGARKGAIDIEEVARRLVSGGA